MLVGKSPFSGCDEDALFWSICNEQPQYPRYLSVDSKSVLVAVSFCDTFFIHICPGIIYVFRLLVIRKGCYKTTRFAGS